MTAQAALRAPRLELVGFDLPSIPDFAKKFALCSKISRAGQPPASRCLMFRRGFLRSRILYRLGSRRLGARHITMRAAFRKLRVRQQLRAPPASPGKRVSTTHTVYPSRPEVAPSVEPIFASHASLVGPLDGRVGVARARRQADAWQPDAQNVRRPGPNWNRSTTIAIRRSAGRPRARWSRPAKDAYGHAAIRATRAFCD